MIKTIVLDADNVVFKKISPIIINQLQKLSGKSEKDVISIRKKYWEKTKIGIITEKENWLGSKKKGYEQGIFGELEIPKEKYPLFITQLKKSYKLNNGCIKFLNKLKSEKFKLYLFSNSSYYTIEKPYVIFKLNNYFEFAYFSHKMKLAKPDLNSFKLFITRTKINPKESLFIDDKDKNLIVAKDLGFNIFKFTNPKDFNQILKK